MREYSIGLAGPGHHKQGGGKRVAEGEHRHHHHRHCYQIATNIVVITMMQVNSLAHYGVKEKALVSLVPKQIDSPSHHIYQVSQMWQYEEQRTVKDEEPFFHGKLRKILPDFEYFSRRRRWEVLIFMRRQMCCWSPGQQTEYEECWRPRWNDVKLELEVLQVGDSSGLLTSSVVPSSPWPTSPIHLTSKRVRWVGNSRNRMLDIFGWNQFLGCLV